MPGPRIVPRLGKRGVVTYVDKVLGYNPIAYWPLWETAGVTATCLVNAAQNGTYTGATLANGTAPDGSPCPLFDGINDYCVVYSVPFRDAFNTANGAVMAWLRVQNVGVWSDAADRYGIFFSADGGNNSLRLYKISVNNYVEGRYQAGGVAKNVQYDTSGDLNWFHLAVTWDTTADEMKTFYNGAQVGVTRSSLGVWAGNLSILYTNIGSVLNSGLLLWQGWIAHVVALDFTPTPAQVADLATV